MNDPYSNIRSLISGSFKGYDPTQDNTSITDRLSSAKEEKVRSLSTKITSFVDADSIKAEGFPQELRLGGFDAYEVYHDDKASLDYFRTDAGKAKMDRQKEHYAAQKHIPVSSVTDEMIHSEGAKQTLQALYDTYKKVDPTLKPWTPGPTDYYGNHKLELNNLNIPAQVNIGQVDATGNRNMADISINGKDPLSRFKNSPSQDTDYGAAYEWKNPNEIVPGKYSQKEYKSAAHMIDKYMKMPIEQVPSQYKSYINYLKGETPTYNNAFDEAQQTVSGAIAGLGRGAVELVDAAGELVTWAPQALYNKVTGSDADIGIMSSGFKKEALSAIDNVVGYDRAKDQASLNKVKELATASGFDLMSPSTYKNLVSQYGAEMVKEMITNPSLTASMVTEIVGSGGALKGAMKVGGALTTKAARKLDSDTIKNTIATVDDWLTTNAGKINATKEARAAEGTLTPSVAKAIEKEYTTSKKIADLAKGTAFTNADMAVRTNKDIEAYRENNNGEAPDTAKMLQIIGVNRLLSAMEVGALKMETKVADINPSKFSKVLEKVSKSTVGHIAKSVGVEAAQETVDGIGEQINQKYNSDKYKDRTLGELLSETSAEIITGTFAGGAGGAHMGIAVESPKVAGKITSAAAKKIFGGTASIDSKEGLDIIMSDIKTTADYDLFKEQASSAVGLNNEIISKIDAAIPKVGTATDAATLVGAIESDENLYEIMTSTKELANLYTRAKQGTFTSTSVDEVLQTLSDYKAGFQKKNDTFNKVQNMFDEKLSKGEVSLTESKVKSPFSTEDGQAIGIPETEIKLAEDIDSIAKASDSNIHAAHTILSNYDNLTETDNKEYTTLFAVKNLLKESATADEMKSSIDALTNVKDAQEYVKTNVDKFSEFTETVKENKATKDVAKVEGIAKRLGMWAIGEGNSSNTNRAINAFTNRISSLSNGNLQVLASNLETASGAITKAFEGINGYQTLDNRQISKAINAELSKREMASTGKSRSLGQEKLTNLGTERDVILKDIIENFRDNVRGNAISSGKFASPVTFNGKTYENRNDLRNTYLDVFSGRLESASIEALESLKSLSDAGMYNINAMLHAGAPLIKVGDEAKYNSMTKEEKASYQREQSKLASKQLRETIDRVLAKKYNVTNENKTSATLKSKVINTIANASSSVVSMADFKQAKTHLDKLHKDEAISKELYDKLKSKLHKAEITKREEVAKEKEYYEKSLQAEYDAFLASATVAPGVKEVFKKATPETKHNIMNLSSASEADFRNIVNNFLNVTAGLSPEEIAKIDINEIVEELIKFYEDPSKMYIKCE